MIFLSKVWHYYCTDCMNEIVAGAPCWECPKCGRMLRLKSIRLMNPPGVPPGNDEADIVDMYNDMIMGLEELLGEH